MAVSRKRKAPTLQAGRILRPVLPVPHQWTVDEYYRMGEIGILSPNVRTELIEGEIWEVPPIGPGHASSVERVRDELRALLGDEAHIRSQNPLHLGVKNEPEPDFAVVRRRDDYYAAEHPTAVDVLLVIEVADSSLAYDRKEKLRLYARAGIADYWIVNLVSRTIEVYRDPAGTRYRSMQTLKSGDTVTPLEFPDVTIPVSELLG